MTGGTTNVNDTRSLARPGLRWLAAGLASGMLAATLLGAGASSALAQSSTDSDQTLRTINVSGEGRVSVAPDVADISLGVTEQAKEASAASRQAAQSMDAVVKALLALGIDEKDIQTTQLNLNPNYDWNKNPATIVSWQASNTVDVTVHDVTMVGDVVDTAVKAGANTVNGVSFRVDDPTEAQVEARSKAVADARAKADQLAADAGVTITGVVSITESGGQTPQPVYYARAEMAAGADTAASTPVLGGQVDLTVNVVIQYEIG
jgi:uncharacterized protein YggE